MYGLLAAYAIIFVMVVWGTVAMISLDFAHEHSPFAAVFLRHRWQPESLAADTDDGLQLTDVLKALIMYAQVSSWISCASGALQPAYMWVCYLSNVVLAAA
jgi:hypothetical protein